MNYECTVGFADGTVSTIRADVADLDALRADLAARGVHLLSARPLFLRLSADLAGDLLFRAGRTARLVEFTRMFATLIRSGVTVVDALTLLRDGEGEPRMRAKLDALLASVTGGSALSAAMAREGDLFDPLYYRSVFAGERSGNLAAVLDRLLQFHRKRQALAKKVLLSLLYPAILAVVALLAIVGLIGYIVPKFAEAFANMEIELPEYTKAVIGLSEMAGHYGLPLFLLALLALAALRRYARTREGRYRLDELRLSLPLFGRVIRFSILANFLRTLSTMLRGGIPLLEALRVTAHAVGNEVFAGRLGAVADAIERGESFSGALARHGGFPDLLPRMARIGEESGRLEEMLEHAADHFDDEVDTLATTLATLLEPLMMMILAAVFLAIMLAMILPVFSMGGSIG